MTIAHISDLHINCTEHRNRLFKNLITAIAKKNVDHLIITGDITENAREEEFKQVVDVLDEYDFFSADRLTVIPGNHDVFPDIFQKTSFKLSTLLSDFKAQPKKISKEIFQVLKEYRNYADEKYTRAINQFNEYFNPTFIDTRSYGTPDFGHYPVVKIINKDTVLICLDTNYVLPNLNLTKILSAIIEFVKDRDVTSLSVNPICSNGWVDMSTLEQVLKDPKIAPMRKYIVMHHYLYDKHILEKHTNKFFASSMALLNREEVISMFQAYRLDLVLHGHWHIMDTYNMNPEITVVNAGDSFNFENPSWLSIRQLDKRQEIRLNRLKMSQ